MTCRDNDEGENGLVDLTIKDGDPDGVFRVSPTKSKNEFYIIMSPVVAKSLNVKGHEREKDFHLTLLAVDGGQPAKSSQKVKDNCLFSFTVLALLLLSLQYQHFLANYDTIH